MNNAKLFFALFQTSVMRYITNKILNLDDMSKRAKEYKTKMKEIFFDQRKSKEILRTGLDSVYFELSLIST